MVRVGAFAAISGGHEKWRSVLRSLDTRPRFRRRHGQVLYEHGRASGAMPGQVLRSGQC
jgi:hypothetical protein